ncbi:hypothetical protein C6P46_006960 [Rhodotorula mucilaginosa]|uniref:DUF1783-domain-containing protein n=1 Tax=Rhodotorula mucilaginosa TaxID=5537 RepID=A0A9P6VXP5_RHOMI|nr:hypothetical protein C6P46_006960 [Rhodotorula mucilaginosa]
MLARLPRTTLSNWSSALLLSRSSAAPLIAPSIQLARLVSSSPQRTLAQQPPAPAPAPTQRPRAAAPPRRNGRDQFGERELPELKSRAPLYLALALIVTLGWGGFLAYATNAERANSSVVRSLAFQLRSWPAVREFLGDGVKIEPLVADFVRIKGSINMLAGKIDVQFRVRGSKAGGTASFTSIRRGKNGRFEVLRWKITRDDGAVLDLMGLDLTKPIEGLE